MSKFTLSILTDNAAFCDADGILEPSHEVVRLLRETAERIERGDYQPGYHRTILDANGANVGTFVFKGDDHA